MNRPWLIYGANGYTGKLIARHAVAMGRKPILAGRNEPEVKALAAELGLPFRIFGLTDAASQLADIGVVLHCAGPFSATAAPMVEACLKAKCHYLDITGEIDVLEWVVGQNARAQSAGIVLLPGAGFDVVPSDCLARHLADRLPKADELELAFTGSSSFSPGTLKTMIENLPSGGKIRREGKIVTVPVAYRSRNVPFGFGTRTVTTIPWGDVATAFHTTGIPNVLTYTRVPKAMRWTKFVAPFISLPVVRRSIGRWIDANVHGPDEAHRAKARMFLWGRAARKSGETVESNLEVAEGYQFTALSAVACAEALEAGRVKPGAWTPGGAFGADFVLSIPGSVRSDR